MGDPSRVGATDRTNRVPRRLTVHGLVMAITDTTESAPATCPFCRSRDVVTTSKHVTAEVYWRCQTCGQIWNPTRLKMFPVRR